MHQQGMPTVVDNDDQHGGVTAGRFFLGRGSRVFRDLQCQDVFRRHFGARGDRGQQQGGY
jgi:hypothetical protein